MKTIPKKYFKDVFKIESSKDLNKEGYEEIIDFMEKYPTEN